MRNMFTADTKDFKPYLKTMKSMPKIIRPAIGRALNRQAADMKFEHIPAALSASMTIRDPRFMNRQIAYNAAKYNVDPRHNFSEVGSFATDRFSGWEEQQTGKDPKSKKVATQAARTGQSFQKKIKRGARMDQKNNFVKPTDFMGSKKVHSKAQAMFFMLREARHSKRPFIVPHDFSNVNGIKMEAGVYGWIGSKLMRLQTFNKRYNPKTIDWLGMAVNMLYSKQGGFRDIYYRYLIKELNRYSK